MDKEKNKAELADLHQKMLDKRLRDFRKENPNIAKSFLEFWRETKKPSAIPAKYKELIQLAIVISHYCKPCIFLHTKLCLMAGATKEEILDAASQALAIGGGIAYEYLAYVMEAVELYEKEVKR